MIKRRMLNDLYELTKKILQCSKIIKVFGQKTTTFIKIEINEKIKNSLEIKK